MYPIAMKKSCRTGARMGMMHMTLQKILACHETTALESYSSPKTSVMIMATTKETSTPSTTEICGYTPKRDPNSLGVISLMYAGMKFMYTPATTPWSIRKM